MKSPSGHPFPKTGSRFLTTMRYMRRPYECYRQWKSRFGDTFEVNALNGNVVATCNAENLRTALAISTDDASQFATETTAPLVGPSSVILIDGARHRQERRILSPSFSGPCLHHEAEKIVEVAQQAADRWRVGSTIKVMDEALDVSLNVIIRVVFGVTNQSRMASFREQIKKFVASFHPILAFTRIFHWHWFGLSPWGRFQREKGRLEAMLDKEIDRELAAGLNSEGMLARILQEYQEQDGGIDRDNVRAQLITMLLAGHETTQIAIAWAMSWLTRYPKVAEALRSELTSCELPDMIKNSKLLDGVCKESLRLNPILPDVVRTIKKPLVWSGFELPPGTNIALATSLVHEDEAIYPSPDRFRPQRWFDWKPKPHQFLPFGGGVRRCLGAPLSLLELKIVILTWLAKFEFESPFPLSQNEPVARRSITMGPRSGIPLVVSRMRQA